MMWPRKTPIVSLVWLAGLTCGPSTLHSERSAGRTAATDSVIVDTLTLLDTTRNRAIPIAIYQAVHRSDERPRVVLISHGYNENLPGTYLRFSSLCSHLAMNGYVAVSIQHELPSDEPLAMTGDLRIDRRPNWERGVRNISFVVEALGRSHPEWRTDMVDLVGHSNGGDMSMLFAETHPHRVGTAISLDNRRMPLPRVSKPRICSIRADDAPADPGVIPTEEERSMHGIRIIGIPGMAHVQMNDRGTAEQRRVLNDLVLELLADR